MEILCITSRKNRMIRDASALARSAAVREEEGRFLAEGARLCRDAAECGLEMERTFITKSAFEKYKDYIDQILEISKEVYEIEDHVAQVLSCTRNSQGIFCVCGIPENPLIIPNGRIVALENLQDPSNVGAIMRSAEALGVGAVIIAGNGCDIYSPKAIRASMGAAFRIPIMKFPQARSAISFLRSGGYASYGAAIGDGARRLGEFRFPKKSAIWIGNEGAGLNSETITLCDDKIMIPMIGKAQSLNAAGAAAILIWEMIKDKANG